MLVSYKRISALMLGLFLALAATVSQARPTVNATADSTSASVLTEDQIATLQFMREEEKLARDVYLTLYGIYGETVFSNIMAAEQTHFDAVGALLEKYGIEDPAANDVHGQFVNPDLQALYYELTTAGAKDLLSALNVGGLIEETDMRDLANAIDESDRRDIDRVYTNLRDGSKNHLRAFVDNVESLGVTYEPQYLTDAELQAILDEAS